MIILDIIHFKFYFLFVPNFVSAWNYYFMLFMVMQVGETFILKIILLDLVPLSGNTNRKGMEFVARICFFSHSCISTNTTTTNYRHLNYWLNIGSFKFHEQIDGWPSFITNPCTETHTSEVWVRYLVHLVPIVTLWFWLFFYEENNVQ